MVPEALVDAALGRFVLPLELELSWRHEAGLRAGCGPASRAETGDAGVFAEAGSSRCPGTE